MNDLNEYLFPKDSPIAQNQGQVTAYQFDYQNEAVSKIRVAAIGSANIQSGAIGSAQIGTISFNQVSGGTASLGGVGNGDGLLTVNNAGGTEVVRLDNTGIVITAGSITDVIVNSTSVESGTLNNVDIGTSLIVGGTISGAIIGTSTVTGGTVNPTAYSIQGTSGVTGTFTYLNIGTVPGTIIVMGGIVTSIT